MGLQQVLRKSESLISMLLSQLITTGLFLLSKIALDKGAFIFALLTYRLLIATISLAPVAYFTERNLATRLSWKASAWIFIIGLLGTAMSAFYYYGLRATSASFASNFANLNPTTTFILSVIIRVEKLELGRRHGRIKLAGAFLGLLGAVLISVYKGNSLHITFSHHYHHSSMRKRTSSEMTHGALLLAGCCLSTAGWLIAQVKLSEVYAAMFSTTMLSCLAACIQSAIIGIAIDRRKSSWRLDWNLQLLTIVYSGVLSSAVNFFLLARAATKRGPTYPSMFSPLALIFVTVLESLFMGEVIYVGSILGMILIIGGLYAFLWKKRNEPPPTNSRDQEQCVQNNL